LSLIEIKPKEKKYEVVCQLLLEHIPESGQIIEKLQKSVL
jgi:hypothetical protein